jgi:hypothetical protein
MLNVSYLNVLIILMYFSAKMPTGMTSLSLSNRGKYWNACGVSHTPS